MKRLVLTGSDGENGVDHNVREGVGLLLVRGRDRLARSRMVASEVEGLIRASGARILSVGVGAVEAGLADSTVDRLAELQRVMIIDRTRAALAKMRRRGERTGGVPYGQPLGLDGAHLEPAPTEQQNIGTILALRREGLTIWAIRDRLNSMGIPVRGSRGTPPRYSGYWRAPLASSPHCPQNRSWAPS